MFLSIPKAKEKILPLYLDIYFNNTFDEYTIKLIRSKGSHLAT